MSNKQPNGLGASRWNPNPDKARTSPREKALPCATPSPTPRPTYLPPIQNHSSSPPFQTAAKTPGLSASRYNTSVPLVTPAPALKGGKEASRPTLVAHINRLKRRATASRSRSPPQFQSSQSGKEVSRVSGAEEVKSRSEDFGVDGKEEEEEEL